MGVSRADYYKWLSRKPSNREVENEAISKDIDLLYHQVDGIYGYCRMTLTINRQRIENNQATVNEKRIYRLMQVSGLKSVIRRKRKPYRKSPAHHVAENVLIGHLPRKSQMKNGVQMSQSLSIETGKNLI